MRSTAAGVLAVALALAAPGTATAASEKTTVKRTVVAYIHALDDGDGTAACRLLTSAGKEAVEEEGPCAATLSSLSASGNLFPHVRIAAIRVDGSRARADARVDGGAVRFPLRRIGGRWLLDSPAPQIL